MLFNSVDFLFFFPIVTILYFLLPHKYRWFHLLIASCVFYCAFIPIYILVLFLTIIIDYIAGIMIEKSSGTRRKWFLVLSIFGNVGVLAFFKYFNFFIANINEVLHSFHLSEGSLPLLGIILPIGLSFHTFQAMSYTIEVYRGHEKAERNFGIYSLYVMFYPQLVAGPIERPQNMLHQFYEEHTFTYENVTNGLKLMLWGMFKKVVIADRLAMVTSDVFNKPHDYPAITLLLAAFFFSFQIFCDFSGYSDIALGAAKVMGFKLMVNFNRPYHSRTISEFWKRWHISLSTWFRDYLYISLGGNRVSVPRWYFNLFFVFLVSGFWHGANWTFIAWGALHGFYLVFAIVFEKYGGKLYRITNFHGKHTFHTIMQVLSTFILAMVAWVFFRANTVHDAVYIIGRFPAAVKDILHSIKAHQMPWLGKLEVDLGLCFSLIFFMEFIHYLQIKTHLIEYVSRKPIFVRWGIYYTMLLLILFFGVFHDTAFIYFQF